MFRVLSVEQLSWVEERLTEQDMKVKLIFVGGVTFGFTNTELN
jgi:hypothetical protein